MKTYIKALLLGAILITQPATAKENIQTLTDENYLSVLLKSDKPTLVKFWAPWCRACTKMTPEFKKASETMKGKVNFAQVNVDEQESVSDIYQIRSLPTIILFKKDKIIKKSVGSRNQESIEKFIKKYM